MPPTHDSDDKAQDTQDGDPEESVAREPGTEHMANQLVPPEMLDAMPDQVRERVLEFGALQMSGFGAERSSLVDKLGPEHITSLIEQAGEDSDRSFRDVQRRRAFSIAILVIVLVFVAYLVNELGSVNPDLLENLVALLVGAVGGFGVGTAYQKTRDG